MVRCDEFYEKWKKAGNFCEKNPRTAAQIDAYLDELEYLNTIASESKDPGASAAFAQVELSEGALRPLISLKDKNLHKNAVFDIVKIVTAMSTECAKKKGKSFTLTNQAVQQVVQKIKRDSYEVGYDVPENQPINVPSTVKVPKTKKPSPEDGMRFMLATIETLIEQGYTASQIGYFYGDSVLKHKDYFAEELEGLGLEQDAEVIEESE